MRNCEIINLSKQHYYIKVHLHIDSAGNLPNRVGIDPGNKLGHVRYLSNTAVGT